MAGIFDTSNVSQTTESSATVKAPVAEAENTMGTMALQLGLDAGKEVVTQHALGEQEEALAGIQEDRNAALGEMRLKALNSKFETLAAGIEQGLPTSQANARARAVLAETKASVPWIGNRADAAFKGFFGGSSGAGGFEPNPLEIAAREHQELVAKTAAMAGSSLIAAERAVKVDAMNKQGTANLLAASNDKANFKDSARAYTNMRMDNASVQAQYIMNSYLPEGTTTLGVNEMASVKSAVKLVYSQAREDLRKVSFRAADGMPLLSKDDLQEQYDAITAAEENQLSLIGDRDYQTIIKNLADVKQDEISYVANTMFSEWALANAAGGQVAVESLNKGIMSPKYVASLVADQPLLAKFFNPDGTSKRVLASSIARMYGNGLTDPTTNAKLSAMVLTPEGIELMQKMVQDHEQVGTARTGYDQLSKGTPEQQQVAKVYHGESSKLNPKAVSKTLSTKNFTEYLQENVPEGSKVLSVSLGGMSQAFKTAYYSAGVGVPGYIEIGSESDLDGNIKASSFTATEENGEPIPDHAKGAIAAQYRAILSNPAYVQHVEEVMGIPLTASEVLELTLNDTLHPKFFERAQEQKEKGSFLGAPGRKDLAAYNKSLASLHLQQKGTWTPFERETPEEIMGKKPEGKMVDPAQSQIDELFKEKPKEKPKEEFQLTQEQHDAIAAEPDLQKKKKLAIGFGADPEMINKATRGR